MVEEIIDTADMTESMGRGRDRGTGRVHTEYDPYLSHGSGGELDNQETKKEKEEGKGFKK